MKLSQLLKEMANSLPEGKDQEIGGETITLYSGKVVQLRETTGLDETIVTRMLGKKFTADAAGAILYRTGLMARSVVSIDGEKPAEIKNAKDIDLFWARFTSKEKSQIDKAYSKLNEFKEDDEELGN